MSYVTQTRLQTPCCLARPRVVTCISMPDRSLWPAASTKCAPAPAQRGTCGLQHGCTQGGRLRGLGGEHVLLGSAPSWRRKPASAQRGRSWLLTRDLDESCSSDRRAWRDRATRRRRVRLDQSSGQKGEKAPKKRALTLIRYWWPFRSRRGRRAQTLTGPRQRRRVSRRGSLSVHSSDRSLGGSGYICERHPVRENESNTQAAGDDHPRRCSRS